MLTCKESKFSTGITKSGRTILYHGGAILDVPLKHSRNLPDCQNPMLIPQCSKYRECMLFFFPALIASLGSSISIIHWPYHPRMTNFTSPNLHRFVFLPRIQFQHLVVAMLLASSKKRWVQHVGCLPLKPHRNLPDVCSWKQSTGKFRWALRILKKHPKRQCCLGASLNTHRCHRSLRSFFGINHLERQMFTLQLHSLDFLGILFQVMFEHGYHHWSSPFEEYVWSFFVCQVK